jgi:AcrR family transcriptional regulator
MRNESLLAAGEGLPAGFNACYDLNVLKTMSLVERHKAERRRRILAAARRLIAQRGYEGLTMRELARASHVSVPTLYNLFGGKQALLLGELEETFVAVVVGLDRAGGRSVAERALAICEAGNRELLAGPRYWRELVHLFLVSDETRPIRQEHRARYVAMMARVLSEGQAAGEIVTWADTTAVAGRMFSHYVYAIIEWAQGDLDAEGFRSATVLSSCLMLLGLARGRAATVLERRARELQSTARASPRARARDGG